MDELEVFMPISGYESLYKISNFGRLKHIKYDRFLVPQIIQTGYYQYCLCKNNIPASISN